MNLCYRNLNLLLACNHREKIENSCAKVKVTLLKTSLLSCHVQVSLAQNEILGLYMAKMVEFFSASTQSRALLQSVHFNSEGQL